MSVYSSVVPNQSIAVYQQTADYSQVDNKDCWKNKIVLYSGF